jgi:hypothetical protein
MTKTLKKFTAEKKITLIWIKNYNLPVPRTLGLYKVTEDPAHQNMKFLNFFLLLWVIFATDLIEFGFNTDSDPKH